MSNFRAPCDALYRRARLPLDDVPAYAETRDHKRDRLSDRAQSINTTPMKHTPPTPTPPAATPPPPPPSPSVTEVCLGLHLAHREIGNVVTTRDNLLRYGVLNIRKVHSQEAKEARFRRLVDYLYRTYTPHAVVIVQPIAEQENTPLMVAFRSWLSSYCLKRNVPLHVVDRDTVKAWASGRDVKATHRQVARKLAQRHPELQKLLPAIEEPVHGELVPAAARPSSALVTARERYWSGMFLALAAAHYTLDQRILRHYQDKKLPPKL